MPRPPMSLGTYGAIRVYEQRGSYRARTLYRDFGGRTRAVERSDKSRVAAESALKLAPFVEQILARFVEHSAFRPTGQRADPVTGAVIQN